MRKKFCKKLSLLLAFAMGVSLSSVPAFAAETTEAAASEDGRTTTITTEITWASPEGKEPVVEGAAVTTETTVLDEEGRVIQESGSETGHETTATETVASGTTVEDKEPVTETTEGETITTETPGEFETVDSSAASSSEAIDPVFKDGGNITVGLTPGSTATGTAEVDKEALAGQLARPDEEDSEITDPGTGESIGHKTVTVEDVLDEDGAVVGFTATTTEETSVTVTLPEGVSSAEPPGMPQPQEPFTDTDGVTTKVDVAPIYDGDGNLTGYQTTTTKTSTTGAAVSETVLPDRPAEGEATDPETGETTAVTVAELRDADGALTGYEVTTTTTDKEGNVRTAVETLRGMKDTSTLTEVTDVTVTTVTFTETMGGAVTTTTRTTTTETKRIAASDRTVTAEMGDVTAGENDGVLETTGVKADVAEPDVGKTDQKTDLHHRADKDGAEFDPEGYDFQWLGKYGLESAIRVDAVKVDGDGTASPSDRWQAHQFVLVDKDGNEHYVYCADFAVSPQAGFRYDMENVEDAGYYDSEAAAHIRAIARNGYWGTSEGAGSLDAVKKMLVDAYNSGEIDKDDYRGLATAWGFDTYLTDGMALAATQAALWTFGNSGDMMIDREDPFTSYYQAVGGKNWRELDDREWALTKALYDYLVSQTEAPTHQNTLINENNFAADASLTVGQRDGDTGKYEADLTFTLAVMPDTESDDLLVHVVVGGEVVETRRLAGGDSGTQYGVIPRSGDGSYTLSGLKLAEGVNIDLRLTGTQNIGEGVYLFTSEVSTEPVGYDGDGEPVFSSQTFVGVESGRQSVDLSVSLNFTVNEAAAEVVTDTASTTERKVDTTETSRTDTTTTIGGWTETAVTVTTVQKNDREWEVTWEKDYTYPDPEPDTPEQPEEPETPETLEDPEVPDTPPAEPPVEDIPEEDVPLVEIPDEEVPAADIPVADVPQTGDDSGLWYLLLMASLAGLTVMGWLEIRDRKKTTVD
ncbi:Cys-Gln thioester bond-forming surface protein [Enterocloster clostridioformis]|uniref:Cys-Gln thioester bond-forming surface protein n=2 Tax=Enterocloster clostridioformis TaxID=1531 RepID=UPI0034A456BE